MPERLYHEPVMPRESLEGLAIKADGVYVDATFGGGGHSKLILKQLGDNGRLIAFDQDEDAKRNLPDDDRLVFVPQNFRYLKRFLRLHGYSEVDGILADLGVSSHQLDEAERGFSFRFEAMLDMRMNQDDPKTAADILNTYPEDDLRRIFSRYGEVRNARTLAARIVQARLAAELKTIGDFLGVLEPLVRGPRHKYLAQVFQALRIEVNDEMGALQDFLEQALQVLSLQGRLVVITYHSLEDRLVKNFLKSGNADGKVHSDFYGNIYRPFVLVNRKPIEPGPDEIEQNPRSRSAKLRIGEKVLENKDIKA